MIIACNTWKFSTDRWSFIGPVTSANSEKDHLPVDICGHVDSGMNTTAGHQLYELGSIPERELERLTQETESLEKASFAFAFYLDRRKEEEIRGVIIARNTKEFSADRSNSIISDALTPRCRWTC